MGKKTDIFTAGENAHRSPRCRMAYSLDNYQPVICTLISDQPLFYYDEAEIFEEDEILMDEEILALDRDIQALKEKIDTYDRFSLEFSQPADTIMREFIANSFTLGEKSAIQGIKFEKLTKNIEKSRMAKALIDCVKDYNVRCTYSDFVSGGLYDANSNHIVINPSLSEEDQYLVFARELRRHWHHRQGLMINPLSFQPDHAILVNRAQEADLTTFMVRIAWELQLSGIKGPWNRIENSALADLGKTFAREAYVDFRTINNGNASAAVFETWFLSDRCKSADQKIIQKMLTDYEGIVFDADQISQSLTIELICNLGKAPYGKNYLAQYASLITSDPIFTDVRDRANANFLWFIKFEKSFRETEQTLQDDGSIPNPDVRSGNFTHKDTHNEQLVSILEFPVRERSSDETSNTQYAESDQNIVYVQFC